MGPLFLHDLLFPSKRIMYVVGCNINGMVCATIGPIVLWNRICIPLWFHEIFFTLNWFYFSYIFGKVKVVMENCRHHLSWKMLKCQNIKFFLKLQLNSHKLIQIGHIIWADYFVPSTKLSHELAVWFKRWLKTCNITTNCYWFNFYTPISQNSFIYQKLIVKNPNI